MKCPICEQETIASVKFCEFCGAELDRDFSHVAGELVRETEEEKVRKIEEEVQGFLVLAIFLFLVALTLHWVIPSPPKVDMAPFYLHQKEKKEESKLTVPLLEQKVPE